MQNTSEFYWNNDIQCIDIRDKSDSSSFDIAGYIVGILQHQAFKSFDGGTTYTGSIVNLLTGDASNIYTGNISALITNKAQDRSLLNDIVEEIQTALKDGSDRGFYSEINSDDIYLGTKNNEYYLKIKIVINKKQTQYQFKISENGVVIIFK